MGIILIVLISSAESVIWIPWAFNFTPSSNQPLTKAYSNIYFRPTEIGIFKDKVDNKSKAKSPEILK